MEAGGQREIYQVVNVITLHRATTIQNRNFKTSD